MDRVPIIVYGKDPDELNDFIIEFTNIIDFRKEFVFFTDFVSISEYDLLIQIEDLEYNSPRIYIRCPTTVPLKELDQFDDFNSWIIGRDISESQNELDHIKQLIKRKSKIFLSISYSPESIKLELEGISEKQIDLKLEQKILQKISKDTEKAVVRMKRVLSERTKSKDIDNNTIKSLLNFETETNEVKKSIFRKEIQNFHSGSKRAFFILSRLKLLNDMNITTTIGSRILFETIDYDNASVSRMISFILKEWKEDYSNLIEEGRDAYLVDKIQSQFG